PAGELKAALGGLQEAGNEPQQRGFAGAIPANEDQRLARRNGEIEPREHLAATADAAEARPLELHLNTPSLRTGAAVDRTGTRTGGCDVQISRSSGRNREKPL